MLEDLLASLVTWTEYFIIPIDVVCGQVTIVYINLGAASCAFWNTSKRQTELIRSQVGQPYLFRVESDLLACVES